MGVLKDSKDIDVSVIVSNEIDNKVADEALFYATKSKSYELTEEENRRLLRKIDWWLMPLVCALMSVQLMDKSTSSYASIMGMIEDLNMTGLEYSWVGTSFYLGYLIFQLPANLILQRFPMSKVLSTVIITWGVVLCCHAACRTSSTFLLCRTLLGILECFMTPAYIILTSQWYKQSEQYMRCSIWLGFQGFGSIVGSGIAYGLYTHLNLTLLAAWQDLYVITGVITIALGIISIFHIPDIPSKAWFLNEKEKLDVVNRIRENNQGFGNKHFKLYQFKEALLDISTYSLLLYMIGYGISNGGLGNFGSIVLLDDFGFGTGQALLMNMIGGGIDIIFPALFAYIQRKFSISRLLVCFFINALNFTGLCLLAFCKYSSARLIGYYLNYLQTASYATMTSIIASNIAGHTKKVTVSAVFLVGFCAGNMIGPQTFLESEASSDYPTAKTVMAATATLCLITPIIMLVAFYYENRKKLNKLKELGDTHIHIENAEFADQTDKENLDFRYCY